MMSWLDWNRLGEIGINWNDLPAETQSSIEETLLYRIKDLTRIGLSTFLVGSVEIDYKWFNIIPIRRQIQKIIELFAKRQINDGTGRELANIIYSFGKTGLLKNEIPIDVIKVLLNGMVLCKLSINGQNISNIIYGYVHEMKMRYGHSSSITQVELEAN